METTYRTKATIATIALLALALFTFLLSVESQQPMQPTQALFTQTAQAQTIKQNGLSYAEYDLAEYKPATMNRMLTELQATGANWVALVVTRYQYAADSTLIYPTVKTATDDDLIYAINRARELGLQVTLKPHVDIASDPSAWRGTIGPNFTEAEWAQWFAAYEGFITHYAALAETHGVEQFVVGTELAATSQRETEWRSIISATRTAYPSGLLTYSANHSGEEVSINWWDALDHVGISAYYTIANNAGATLADLEAGWQSHVNTLSTLAANTGKSIIFTEVGFRSTDGAATQPWCSDCGGALDEREQADAYQAFYNVIYNQPWFAGMYWWGWNVAPANSGPCDGNYSPYNKAAENVIRQAHGVPAKNLPADCNSIPATATPITVAPTSTPSAPSPATNSGFTPVEDFVNITAGLPNGQNGWTTLGNANITADPIVAGNQVIRLQGENVIAQRGLPLSITDQSLATIHYRMLRDGTVDHMSGASEQVFPTTFGAFEPQFGVQLGQADAFRVRDEDDFLTLDGSFDPDTWYCVWIVVDMSTIESEIYVKGGSFANATQLTAAGQTAFQFRNGDADILRTFYTRTGWDGGGAVYLDDIYVDGAGKNLASPVADCQEPNPTPTPTLPPTLMPTQAAATATALPTDTPTMPPTTAPTTVPTTAPTTVPNDTPTDTPTATTMPTANPTPTVGPALLYLPHVAR